MSPSPPASIISRPSTHLHIHRQVNGTPNRKIYEQLNIIPIPILCIATLVKCSRRFRTISSVWRGIKRIFGKLGQLTQNSFKAATAKIPRSTAILAVSLVLIFTIAFLLRISPVFMAGWQPLLKEFDPYYFYRNVQFIIGNGFPAWFHWVDYSAWYPFGRFIAGDTYPGMVFTAVLFYYFVNAIGISASAFTVCYYMPLLFGALTPLVVYLLGKEIYDKRSGLLAAFFIAVSPAIIQRQVVGFFDNEPFGIFLMLISFYFFIRSLKRGSFPSAILAGLFLGYLCISWGTFRYGIDIFALFAGVMLITRRYSMRLFTTYSITMLIGLFIMVLAPRNGVGQLASGEILPALMVLGLMVLYETSKYLAQFKTLGNIGSRISKVNPFLLAAIVAVGGFIILTISPIGGKFYTVIMPIFRQTQEAILASVGEHQPTPWADFFYYLGILVVLSIVGIYFSFKRLSEADIFIILATVTLVYFSGSMVRIVISLSPIIAILAGYGLSSVLRPFGQIMAAPKEEIIHRKRVRMTPTVGREYAAAAFLVIGILLFSYGNMIIQPGFGSRYPLIQGMSPPEILPAGAYGDWLEAMSWLNNQAPPGAVVVAWWDYGYYITVVGNRTSVDDNGTGNSTQIACVGLGFMETNETASLQIFRRFHADYALVFFGFMQSYIGGDEGKWIWMARIAADNFPNLINTSDYYNETSQVTRPLFQNTTLYRLMFNNEPHSYSDSLDISLVYFMGTAAGRGTSTKNFMAVAPIWADTTTTYLTSINDYLTNQGATQVGWSGVTSIDDYGPRFFQRAFFSSSDLVKIYKIDYTPLDMLGNLVINASDTFLYKNGTAVISATNMGSSGAPAIPLNTLSENVALGAKVLTRLLTGSVWINGTKQASIPTLNVWNQGTASWIPHTETYYLSAGQTVKFRVTGLNATMLGLAYNKSMSMPLRLYSAYDNTIFDQVLVPVLNA